MATLDIWVNELVPRLPGVLVSEVKSELQFTIKDFFRRSTVWREMLYDVDVTAGDREVSLPTDGVEAGTSGYRIEGILRAYYNGMQITNYSHVPWEVESEFPMGYTGKPGNPYKLVLSTIPTLGLSEALDVLVYGSPNDMTGELPYLATDTFYEQILTGVLGRMHAKNGKPWADPAQAAFYMRRYRAMITEARDMGGRGHTANAQNWVFPSFGR